MNDWQFIPVGGALQLVFDFSDVVTDPVTLSSVAFTITPQSGSPVRPVLSSQSDDLANAKSGIIVSGVTHGEQYVLQAAGTLSSGEIVVKDAVCVGFDG